jgi:2,5-furandicarboxylate decarboxylase 1
MPKDLRYFIRQIEEHYPDEILRIEKEVDPKFELSAVMHKVQRAGLAPLQIFQNVRGYDMPVLANLWGSRKLIAAALETTVDQARARTAAAEDNLMPTRSVGSGPVQDIVITGDAIDLMRELPIVTHCEQDSGPFICPGVLLMRNPDTSIVNFGMYRHQVHERNVLGASLGPPSHGAHIFRKAEARGEDVEVVLALGHHPAMGIASQHSGSIDVSELEVMGGLLGEPVEMVPCKTVDLEVPAFAEIAIEGKLKAGVRRQDAPFGEFTWYYGGPRMNAVIEVTAITRRRDALFHDLYNVGNEHVLLMCAGLEPSVYRCVKTAVPQVREVYMPLGGVGTVVYVQIKKEYDGLGKNTAIAALSAHAFISTAVVVDEDVNVFSEDEVMWAISTRCNPERQFVMIPEAHVCRLDPSSYSFASRGQGGLKTKLAIDATKPVEIEFAQVARPPQAVLDRVDLREFLPARLLQGVHIGAPA